MLRNQAILLFWFAGGASTSDGTADTAVQLTGVADATTLTSADIVA